MTTDPDYDAYREGKQVHRQERRDTCENEGCTTNALDYPAEHYDASTGKYVCRLCWDDSRPEKKKEVKKANHSTGRLCGECGLPYEPIEDEPHCAKCVKKSNE